MAEGGPKTVETSNEKNYHSDFGLVRKEDRSNLADNDSAGLDYENDLNQGVNNDKTEDEASSSPGQEHKSYQEKEETEGLMAMDTSILIKPWDRTAVKLVVKQPLDDKPNFVTLDYDAEPFCIQYLVHCGRDILHQLADKAGCKLKVQPNCLEFWLVKDPAQTDVQAIRRQLTKGLKENVNRSDLEGHHLYARDEHDIQTKFLAQIEENPPRQIKAKEGVLLRKYDKPDVFVLVGKKEVIEETYQILNDFLKKAKRNKEKVIKMDEAKAEMVERLNLLEVLNSQLEDKNIKCRLEGQMIICEGQPKFLENCEEMFDLLYQNIRKEELCLKSEDLPVIRISDCEIEEFVMKGLKDSGLECLVHVLSGSLVLYAWKDDMIRKGKENIKECLTALRQQGEGNNAEGSNVTQKSQHTSGIHGKPNTIQKTEESSFSSDSAKFCSNPAIASSSKENSPAVHSANITSCKQQNEMDGSYQTKPGEEMATRHHGDKDVMAKGGSDDTHEKRNEGLQKSEAGLSENSKKPSKRLNNQGYLETNIDLTEEVNVGLARSKSNMSPGHMVSSPLNNANMSSKLNTEKDHMKDEKKNMKEKGSAMKNEEIRSAEADLHPGNEDKEKHDEPSTYIGSQENVNAPNVQGENVRVPLLENNESIHKESGIVADGNILHRNLLAVDVLKDEGDGTAGLNDQLNGSKAVRSSSMPVNTQGQDISNTDGDEDLSPQRGGINPLQKVENKTEDMNHGETASSACSGSISSAKVKTDTDSGNNMSGGNKMAYLSMRDTLGYETEENGKIHSEGFDSKDSSEQNLKPEETLQTLVDANDAEKVVGENSLDTESMKTIPRTDSQHEVMNKGIANEKSRTDTGEQPMEKVLMAPTCQEMIRTSEPSEREGLPTPTSNFDSVSGSLPREMKNQGQIGHVNGEKYSSNVPSPGNKRHHSQSSGKQLEPNSEIEGEEQKKTSPELAKSTLIEKQYDMDKFWFKLLEMESVRTEITERLKSRLEAGSHISWHTAVENERCMLYITASSVENCEKCQKIVEYEMLVELEYPRKDVLRARASLDELKTTHAFIEVGFDDIYSDLCHIRCLDKDSDKIKLIMNLSSRHQNDHTEDTNDCVAKHTRSKMRESISAGGISRKNASKSEDHIQFAADVLDFLKFHDKDTLKSLGEKFKVEIQFTSSGICLQGYTKQVEEAKTELEKATRKLLSGDVKCVDSVQVDLLEEDIGTIIEKTKESCKEPVQVSCIGLDKTEPSYYCSWISDQCTRLLLIVTYGRVENTKADAMVFPCSSDLNPVGTKSWDIIRRGGESNIMDSIKRIKSKKFRTSEVIKHCGILLSEQTGNLDLQNLIFARIPAWTNENSIDANGLDGLCKELLKVINEQGLRRVVIPVDISSDFVYEEFSNSLAYSLWSNSTKELKHHAEIHLCVSTKEKAETLRKSCHVSVGGTKENVSAILHYVPIYMMEGDDVTESDRAITCVQLHKGSLVDMDSKVDVIVNSTNTKLDLSQGYVSSSLLKKAGDSIQSECNKMSPIGIGDVASSGPGNMKCKEIYHGVLLSTWIPSGNFSLHVMRCVMLKCLLKAENSGYTSMAFPALGTGNLGYPWHNVAETMFDVVDDYFAVVPSSCIKMVYFVLQSKDEDTIRAFEFKEKVREAKAFNTEEPKERDHSISYLETRIPEHGVMIQAVPEDSLEMMPEKPDIYIKFEKMSTEADLYKLHLTFDENPLENRYYCKTKTAIGSKAFLIALVETLKKINSRRFVSVAIELKDIGHKSKIEQEIKKLKEKVMTTLREIYDGPSMSASSHGTKKVHGKIYSRKFYFVLREDLFKQLENKQGKPFKLPWEQSRDWNIVTRSFGSHISFNITTKSQSDMEAACQQIRAAADSFVSLRKEDYIEAWSEQKLGASLGSRKALNPKVSKRLEWSLRNKWSSIRMQQQDGKIFLYDLDKNQVFYFQDDKKVQYASLVHREVGKQKKVPPERPPPPNFEGKDAREKSDSSPLSPKTGKGTEEEDTIQGNILNPQGETMEIFTSVTASVNAGLQQQGEEKIDQKLVDIGSLLWRTEGESVYLQSPHLADIEEAQNVLSKMLPPHTDQHAVSSADSEIDSKDKKPLLLAQEALTKLKCTEMEYKALQFYHADDSWFQATADKIRWENDEICLKSSSEEDSKKMKDLLKQISDMNMHEITFESDETDKYSTVLNELESSFSTAFLFEHEDKLGITVLCDSYETSTKVKHKADVLLGRIKVSQGRRRNRFAENTAGNDASENHASSRRNRQFMTNESNVSNTQRSAVSNVNSVDFHTREGILVKVYSDSITRLSVDCIVNAANDSLMHGGGVAYAISNAAGYAFDQESRAYIREHGKIPVGNCCTTGAGNLQYKCVIHTVGPRWHDYNDKRLCEKDLQQAVEVTFSEAVKQGCDSIAVPAISSGIFGVPWDVCIKQYYQAVVSYSQSAVHRVKEIHFVDKDQRMVDNIARKFKEFFSSPDHQGQGNNGYPNQGNQSNKDCSNVQGQGYNDNNNEQGQSQSHFSIQQGLGYPASNGQSNVSSTGQRSYSSVLSQGQGNPPSNHQSNISSTGQRSHRNMQSNQGDLKRMSSGSDDEELAVFEVCSKTSVNVRISVGDIIKVDAEAIVCPQDVKCQSTGGVAKAIHSVADQLYRPGEKGRLSNMRIADVAVLETLDKIKWKYVFHVIPPRWQRSNASNSGYFDKNLGFTYKTILNQAKEFDVHSIVVPLLGFGDSGYKFVVEKNSEIFPEELEFFPNSLRKAFPLDIHIVCNDKTILSTMVQGFSKRFKRIPLGTAATGEEAVGESNTEGDDLSKTVQPPSFMVPIPTEQTEGNCAICMDEFTDPQKLRKCGHVFCKECIEQYFSYKPSCPNCGVIYGKITGDQPEGRIAIAKDTTRLPGYGSFYSIKVTYVFMDGKQGPDHPSPGTSYKGFTRSGWLPDNKEGRLVAKLLNVAFTRKLVFTIGRSRTTGNDDVLTWNDIHHKTRTHGGTERFGYPDPTYIERVMDELSVKGVTEESADDPAEYIQYSKVFNK